MAEKYTILFELNGYPVVPKEWQDIEIIATFGDSIQPIIEMDEFTFVNNDAQFIIDWAFGINGGKPRQSVFEGIPFVIQISSQNIGILEYKCTLDLSELKIISPIEVKCKIKPYEDLDLIGEKLEAFTFGYLSNIGEVFASDFTDVKVIVRKKFDATETALASVTIFLLTKQFEEIKNSTKWITYESIKIALSTPTQKPAEIFQKIVMVLLFIAYRVALIVALIQMLKSVYESLIPRATKYKGITLRKGLEKILGHIDVDLDCDIPELDKYVYLPSKTDDKIRANRNDEGIPNVSDYGYQALEFIQLVYKLFRARGVLVNENNKQRLIIVPEKSDRLQRQSNYKLPNPLTGDSLLMESYRYNTEDFKSNFLISFEYDPSDEWTMPNARNTPFDSKKRDEEKNRHKKGVAFELNSNLVNIVDQRNNLTKGFEEVKIPLALGHRRDTLGVLEQSLKVLTATADLVIKLFGGKTFAEKIDEGKGRLLISHNSFNIAKLLVIENGLIPQNHRDQLSAKYLYDNYHHTRSFKTSPELSQKKIYENIRIPFGFDDFMQTQRNSYFSADFLGQNKCKFRELKWRFSSGTAIATIEVNEQYLEPNLIDEKPIEI